MKKRVNINKIKVSPIVLIFTLLFFVVVILRMAFLALSPRIDGINIKKFENSRNTRKKVVYAKRGNIYDSTRKVLAQTVNSYTIIAYLSPSRSEGFKTPQHVVDKEATAKALAPLINTKEEIILKLLNQNLYQTELGIGGRNISELKKEEIEKLNLPGIGFVASYKRYYQNDDFASYILGYVKTTDDGQMIGEMGIEQYYDDMLKGEDGFVMYQQDINGYKIPNTREEVKESEDGVDIYLTIDSNIQFFAEKYTKEAYEKYTPEWAITVVLDGKTGAVLASTSYPSFNPNIKNITNYLNPLVSFTYEPGSTMKTFTYMAAMEKKVYDGNATFESGSNKFGENIVSDWRPQGFGTITYDEGYILSSNVGISYLTRNHFTADELRNYFEKFGFGKKTGIELPGELPGTLNFKVPFEIANAGFGQGISITPIQMMQALTSISNDGVMLKPYIVEKIVDSDNNMVYQGGKIELGKVVSSDTVSKMKDLMYKVIYNDLYYSTGAGFKMKDFDLIGKTGTAQFVDTSTGKYYYDDFHYIRSFTGMFPKDDPQIIIYSVMKCPYATSRGIQDIVKGLVNDISNYKGIYSTNSIIDSGTYKIGNYSNKNLGVVKSELEEVFKDIVVIGNGDKIIDQFPEKDSIISTNEKIYLVSNGEEITIPDMTYWSRREVDIFAKLSKINCKISGNGFVYFQSIEPDAIYKKELEVKLKERISKINTD